MTTGQSLKHAIEEGNQGDRRSQRPSLPVTDSGVSNPRRKGVTASTPTQLLNRGYNLMIIAFLFLIGLAMGTNAIPEGGFSDKIDDFGLFAVGVIAVVWYLACSN